MVSGCDDPDAEEVATRAVPRVSAPTLARDGPVIPGSSSARDDMGESGVGAATDMGDETVVAGASPPSDNAGVGTSPRFSTKRSRARLLTRYGEATHEATSL